MNTKTELWVEKYRPKNVNNLVQQDDIKLLLKQVISNKMLTHMLLYGPPGTGKTSVALALAKTLFFSPKLPNEDSWNHIKRNEITYLERIMELNASDERGIKVVRDKIKNFASVSIKGNNSLPSYKIIILDEADAMTNDSQYALRRIIEKYTLSTRFILICNYVTRIIPPLASRCAKFRFQSISLDAIHIILNKIITTEKITIDESTINLLFKITKGDLRKAINLLQRAYYINNVIDSKTIIDVAGIVSPTIIKKIWNIIIDPKITNIQLFNAVKNFYNKAYSSIYLIHAIFDLVLYHDIPDHKKIKIIITTSDIDHNLTDNASEFLQILKYVSFIKYVIFYE
jgi:replication factor C subunit 2/4